MKGSILFGRRQQLPKPSLPRRKFRRSVAERNLPVLLVRCMSMAEAFRKRIGRPHQSWLVVLITRLQTGPRSWVIPTSPQMPSRLAHRCPVGERALRSKHLLFQEWLPQFEAEARVAPAAVAPACQRPEVPTELTRPTGFS